MQGTQREIDFNIIRTGKIELKLSEQDFKEHDKNWKKTKMKLNLWDEHLLKFGTYKKIDGRVKLETKIVQSAFFFFSFFSMCVGWFLFFCFFADKSKNHLLWVKIVCSSSFEKIGFVSDPNQIIFDSILEPDYFKAGEDIYLMACGWGKCEIIGTIFERDEKKSGVNAKPIKLNVNIPQMSMFLCFLCFFVCLHVYC